MRNSARRGGEVLGWVLTVFLLMISSALHNHLVDKTSSVLPGSDGSDLTSSGNAEYWHQPQPSGGQGKSYLAPSHCLIQVNSQSVVLLQSSRS